MAVVVFDPAAFKLAFPEFTAVPDARLTVMFSFAEGLIDNTDASIVADITLRTSMLYLAVAHLLTLFGTTLAGTPGGGPSGVVGRLSSATEGSVSTSFEFNVPVSPGSAWWNQTQYGAMLWIMMARFRSFQYVAIGNAGVGRAHDFRNRGLVGPINPDIPGGT